MDEPRKRLEAGPGLPGRVHVMLAVFRKHLRHGDYFLQDGLGVGQKEKSKLEFTLNRFYGISLRKYNKCKTGKTNAGVIKLTKYPSAQILTMKQAM